MQYIPNRPNSLAEWTTWGNHYVQQSSQAKYKPATLVSILNHVIKGIYYRFPLCCVKYFVGLHVANIPAAAYVASKLKDEMEFKAHHSAGFVLCPVCLAKNKQRY